MKLWGIIRFEIAYQLRRGWPWLIAAALLVFAFLMTRDNSLAEALYEDFFVNSPFAIAKTTVAGSAIWLLVAAAVAGEAAARDVSTGMHPLTWTVPVSTTEYLGGRFLAALVINALIALAVQAGILLAIYLPGVEAEAIGPFRPGAYLTAYAFIGLPNAFAGTAIQFALAARSGRPMASYLGSLLLFFMGFFVASFLFFRRASGALLDPIGIRFIVDDLSHQWTTIEKSQRMLELAGTVLANRLLWVGIALGILGITFLRFRFAHRAETKSWRRKPRIVAPLAAGSGAAHAGVPNAGEHRETDSTRKAVPTFGFGIETRKALVIAWTSLRGIAVSWPGLAMLVAIPLVTVLVVLDQVVAAGAPLVPTTARVITELTGPLSSAMSRWVIVPLFITYFAGELVWQERDAGLGEITDAMPGSEWSPLAGKLLGLGLVLVLFMSLLIAAGVLAQVIRDYHDFEVGLYLKVLFGLQLPDYLLFAVLASAVHVVIDQKYVGHLVTIMAYVFIAMLAGILGIEHNLLVYGAGPVWSYTPMRGFGASIGPWLWFKLYWGGWALLLAVAAKLFWVRGRERGVRLRIDEARRRLTRPTAAIAGAAATLVLTLGGFVFYNTNVLNEYRPTADANARRAEYERRYRRYRSVPQPHLTGATLRIEIYPDRGAVDVRGSYRLVNADAQPVDSVHVATAPGGVETRAIAFDRAARLAVDDEALGYRIYALDQPIEPGDTLRLDFEVHVRRRGFGNHGVDPAVAERGSYFTATWLPMVGYQPQRELVRAADRREHGLEPRPVIASLNDGEEDGESTAHGDGVTLDAVVGTVMNQVAVAPGALRDTWTERGRRYFHYSTDAPIGNEWAFFSADYAVQEASWNPGTRVDSARSRTGNGPASDSAHAIAIRIFHHPKHTAHLDRMMRSVRASLTYYGEQFGPYPYRYLTLVENPGGAGTGAHAEPGMISYGQGHAFWIPKGGPSLDFPSAVIAHEIAHQWTVPYALVEGAPFLSEGLAWYSAMQAVRSSRGNQQLRQLLAFMRQPYPYQPIRRGEPLLRALDPYLSYRRGPFALYALSEYIGSDRVNGAIRRLIQRPDSAAATRVTTLDLYRELQAVTPDSLRYLLHDLFEVNTFWKLATDRVTAKRVGGSAWQVALDVRAEKVVYDSAGIETVLPMDEWIPIGVFAPNDSGDELGSPLHVGMHRIRAGTQSITVTVPRKPALGGIDPYHLLDWDERENDDNIQAVKIGGPADARTGRTGPSPNAR